MCFDKYTKCHYHPEWLCFWFQTSCAIGIMECKNSDITSSRENLTKEINDDRRDLLYALIAKFGPRMKMMLGIRKLTNKLNPGHMSW